MSRENEVISQRSKEKFSQNLISSKKEIDNCDLICNEDHENEWQQEYRLIYSSYKIEKPGTDNAGW